MTKKAKYKKLKTEPEIKNPLDGVVCVHCKQPSGWTNDMLKFAIGTRDLNCKNCGKVAVRVRCKFNEPKDDSPEPAETTETIVKEAEVKAEEPKPVEDIVPKSEPIADKEDDNPFYNPQFSSDSTPIQ